MKVKSKIGPKEITDVVSLAGQALHILLNVLPKEERPAPQFEGIVRAFLDSVPEHVREEYNQWVAVVPYEDPIHSNRTFEDLVKWFEDIPNSSRELVGSPEYAQYTRIAYTHVVASVFGLAGWAQMQQMKT